MKSQNPANDPKVRARCVITPLWTGRRTIAIFEAQSSSASHTHRAIDHLHLPHVELLADDGRHLSERAA
jgi:hypothetical protein